MGGIPLANVDTSGSTSTIAYVTAGQLGTPRAIATSSGTTEWQLPYQGNPWSEVTPTSNGYVYNLRSAGEYADSETGLNDNIHRTRNPSLGRFGQSDPTGLFGGISTYAAVGNNPLRLTDRLGLQDEEDEDPYEAWLEWEGSLLGPNQANQTQYQVDMEQGECMAPGAKPSASMPSLLPETPLFRAVSPAELSDIQNSDNFSDPYGTGGKYFSTTPEGAASYAQQAYSRALNSTSGIWGPAEPFTTIQTSIPTPLITPDMVPGNGVDGGIPTVVVPVNLFRSLAPPVVVPYNAVPGR